MGGKTVTAMYTSKDNLTPLLYSGKIIKKNKLIKKMGKRTIKAKNHNIISINGKIIT